MLYAACVGKLSKSTSDKRNEHLGAGRLREALVAVLGDRVVDARSYSTTHDHLLNHNAFSVYNLQDDTQRWFDMYASFEIRTTTATTPSEEAGTVFGIQLAQVKHRPMLADLLANWPYSDVERMVFGTGNGSSTPQDWKTLHACPVPGRREPLVWG